MTKDRIDTSDSGETGDGIDRLENLSDKIAGDDLRDFAAGTGEGVAEVIIELDLPKRQVEFSDVIQGATAGATGLKRPARVVTIDADEESARTVIDSARNFLSDLTGTEPLYFNAARAFLVEADRGQLRQIANQKFCARIDRNRSLK